MNTRSLTLFVGTLSLLLGIWAVVSDTAAMGVAAGAVGFVAGLMALLVPDAHAHTHSHTRADTAGAAAQEPAGSTRLATDVGNGAGGATLGGSSDRPGAATTGAESTTAAGATDRRRDAHGRPDPAAASGAHPGDNPDGDTAVAGTPASGGPPAGTGSDGAPGGVADGGPQPTPGGASLMDPETELFSESYLKVALESRLASARRHLRPVALGLMEVAEGLPDQGGSAASPTTVAEAVSRTLRDSDIACRMQDGTFAVILEDTPENGAVWTMERIRRNLVSTSGHHTLWAGVACYPAHAFDGPELLDAVGQALEAAKAWNQDRIEVAIAD